MRIKAGTLGVDIIGDGTVLDAVLKRSDSLTEAFSANVDRRMKRAGNSLRGVGTAAGMTEKEVKSLEDRMRQGMAADSAARSLDNLRRYAGLTANEYQHLAAKMGIATRESDKASLSLAGLVKRAGAAAAAYVSLREGARAAGDAFGQFAGYESDLTDMAKVTDQSLSEIDAAIKAMPRSLGDPDALVKGYYQTISAGVTDATAAMDMLTTAAKASKAAHTAQDETIKGLTKTMAGFDGELRNASEAADLLFTIEKLGQTNFSELVPVIGDVAASTHLVGVSSQEMAAGLSLITQTSGSTAEAATKWRAIMIGLYKPTENMQTVLKALGYQSGVAMVQQLGFEGALRKLQGTADKSGFSLGKLFESAEALTGIAGLSAQDWGRYDTMLRQVADGAGSAEAAFARTELTARQTKDTYDATLKQMAIEFGRELAPTMTAGMREFADTVQQNKDPIITVLGGIEVAIGAIGSAAMAAARAYNNFANNVAAGIAVIKGQMDLDDWIWNGGDALAKKLQAAGDRVRAQADQQAKESRTQQLLAGDNTGAIPELAKMFPADAAPKAEKAKRAVDGIKVALKDSGKAAENAALAAERYGERSEAYYDQVRYAIDSLTDSLSGGMESDALRVDKTFEKMFADIRKSVIGAKGDTSGFMRAWVEAEQAWPVLRMVAEVKDLEKELDKLSKFARDMGTYQSDPQQLMASDWIEGYKQYVQDLREARTGTDNEDVAAVARAQARWDAYQEHVLQAQRNRLEEGGKLDEGYWESEKQALKNHLAAVREVASDETGYKVYEADRWDAYLKAQLEEQAKYAGSFGETLAAKWSLAFGGYESETTRAKKRWDSVSDGLIEGTNGVVDAVSGGMGDIVRLAGNGADAVADIGENLKSRLLDMLASLIEKAAKMLFEDFLSRISGDITGGSGSFLSSLLGRSSSSGSDSTASLKMLGDYLGKASGESFGSYLSTAATNGATVFAGGSEALSKVFSEGIDMSALTAHAATWSEIPVDAMAATYNATEKAAMSTTSFLGTLGGTLGFIGAIGGLAGLAFSLFGEKKKEVTKTASGYNVQYAGGKTVASGVDFYSDGSVVGTGASDPDVTRKISEAFKDAAENLSDFADVLGFTVDVLDNFSMPAMNITDDQLDTYIRAGTNAEAFQALEQAGLRGAFDMLAEDGEVYIDEVERLSTAFSTGSSKLSAYGYSMAAVAQVTDEQIAALREQTIETAAGTSDAIQAMAQSMGATSDQLAILSANASDGSQALAVTDEQLTNLLTADWVSKVEDHVGGEDAFNSIMDTLLKNIFDSIDAYAENLDYYHAMASKYIAQLGDDGVTVANFWEKFDAALKNGMDPETFELWAKASTWVNSIDSVNDALADWNQGMRELNESLDARMQKAQGLDYQASITSQLAAAEKELYEARKAGYDAAYLARLQEVQAAELQALVRQHQEDYAKELLAGQKRIAEAQDDQWTLVEIQRKENEKELADLAKTYNWSPGSSEEELFQTVQTAQTLELLGMVNAITDKIRQATDSLTRTIAQREASTSGNDELAEALSKIAGYEDELASAYENGIDTSTIERLMQSQQAELAKYWSDILGTTKDTQKSIRDLVDTLTDSFNEFISTQTSLLQDAQSASESLASTYHSDARTIREALRDWSSSSDPTLNAREAYQAAQTTFDEIYRRALAGDTDALSNLTSYGQTLKDAAGKYFGNESDFKAFYSDLTKRMTVLSTSTDVLGDEQDNLARLYDVQLDLYELLKEELGKDSPDTAYLAALVDGIGLTNAAITEGTDVQAALKQLTDLGGGGYQQIADKLTADSAFGSYLQQISSSQVTLNDYLGQFLDLTKQQTLTYQVQAAQTAAELADTQTVQAFLNSATGQYAQLLAATQYGDTIPELLAHLPESQSNVAGWAYAPVIQSYVHGDPEWQKFLQYYGTGATGGYAQYTIDWDTFVPAYIRQIQDSLATAKDSGNQADIGYYNWLLSDTALGSTLSKMDEADQAWATYDDLLRQLQELTETQTSSALDTASIASGMTAVVAASDDSGLTLKALKDEVTELKNTVRDLSRALDEANTQLITWARKTATGVDEIKETGLKTVPA